MIFCILAGSILASAESFKYLYAGNAKLENPYYQKINNNPISINFLEDNEAIQLVVEGESIMFYIIEVTQINEYEMIILTTTKSGDGVKFACVPGFIIFRVDDVGYIATNIPKYAWND